MKVLQTLGQEGGHQAGIFQYRRNSRGIEIDASVGRAKKLTPQQIMLTNQEWTSILRAIENAKQKIFRLSGSNRSNPPPPSQVIYDFLKAAVPRPAGGWQWNDSWRSYVCAILEHEGSVDLYHGTAGRGNAVFIPLARDI